MANRISTRNTWSEKPEITEPISDQNFKKITKLWFSKIFESKGKTNFFSRKNCCDTWYFKDNENTPNRVSFDFLKNNYPKIKTYKNPDKNRFDDCLFIIINVIRNSKQVIIIIIWYRYENRY